MSLYNAGIWYDYTDQHILEFLESEIRCDYNLAGQFQKEIIQDLEQINRNRGRKKGLQYIRDIDLAVWMNRIAQSVIVPCEVKDAR